MSTIGLEAMGFLAKREAPDKAWVDSATAAIEKEQKFFDASTSFHVLAQDRSRPASEVLIAILPGIVELAKAAEHIGH